MTSHHKQCDGKDVKDDIVGQTYFNLDGDKELYTSVSAEYDEKLPLSWRGDPELTISDWRIIIVTKSHKPRTYNVHKSILGSGPRSSKYFAKLFSISKTTPSKHLLMKNNSIVSNSSSTKIELEERDAKNIPHMLDFIYEGANMSSLGCGGTVATASSSVLSSMSSFQLQSTSSAEEDSSNIFLGDGINTNNVVSLRHLSRLFGCDALTLAINKFIQRDLNFKTGPIYYKHAYEYKDDRLLEAAKRLCSENFEQISVKALMRLPINLLKELIQSLKCGEKKYASKSLVLSEVVYLYMERHPEYLTAENLLDLSDPLTMPKIGPEPAIGFTALVKDLDSKDVMVHWNRLSDLCKRCAEAVVGEFGWNDFNVESALDEYLASFSQNRSSRTDSLLFATSFGAALYQAQKEHLKVKIQKESLEAAVVELKKTIRQLECSNQRKEEHIQAQKHLSEESKRQILYLKKKLARPNKNGE